MKKILTSSDTMYALLCYCYARPLICGIYAEKEEAKKIADEVKGCPARHSIRKCKVTIKLI